MAPESAVVPKPATCASWTEWPYSWTMTSASSASSTPALPSVMSVFVSRKKELSPPNWLMRTPTWRRLTAGSVEPKPRIVALRLGDPVVGHDLLELVLIAREDEAGARVRSRRLGVALDRDVRAAQRSRAREVGERDPAVGAPQIRIRAEVVDVLLVGQGLDAEVGHRVGSEDLSRRGRGACRRRDRQGARDEQRACRGTRTESKHVFLPLTPAGPAPSVSAYAPAPPGSASPCS